MIAALLVVGGGAVLAWQTQRPEPVPIVIASAAPLLRTVVFSGRVEAPARVELGATVTGRVLEVSVREGDAVRAATVLARLETSELRAQLEQARAALRLAESRLQGQQQVTRPTSDAALEQARANLEAARLEARRSADLFGRGYVSQARVDETQRALRVAQAQLDAASANARAQDAGGTETVQARLRVEEARAAVGLAQARFDQARVLAPADGRIVTRLVDPGQVVQPGRALFGFAADGPTQLVGQADERFLAELALGQPARAVADAFSQQPFDARISRIAPAIDPQRGTVEVTFEVGDPPSFLREDMTVSMQVLTARRERTLVIPASAVMGLDIDAAVRLLVDGRIVERRVRTGLRTLDAVEILEGIAEGEAVLRDPLRIEPGRRARATTDADADAARTRPTAGSGSGQAGAAMAASGAR